MIFVNRFGIMRDMAEYRLTITAMYGKEIYHTNYLNPTAELISTIVLPARIYFIEVRKGKKVSVQKSIKQKTYNFTIIFFSANFKSS